VESIFPALVIILFWIVRALLADGKRAAVPDATELSRRADAQAAKGNLSLAEHTVQALIKKAEKEDGPNSVEVGIYLRRLARLKAEQGDKLAAESLLQRVLSIQEKNLGPNSPDLLQTLDWLMQLSRARGDLDSGIAWTHRARRLRRK
jgi:tetratricopeptide (TPR) repeat protein